MAAGAVIRSHYASHRMERDLRRIQSGLRAAVAGVAVLAGLFLAVAVAVFPEAEVRDRQDRAIHEAQLAACVRGNLIRVAVDRSNAAIRGALTALIGDAELRSALVATVRVDCRRAVR